jgi:DHA2 family multidrug resistance protein
MAQMGDPQTAAVTINQMITQQGLQISFNEVFYLLGWVFLSLVFVIWMARPPFAAKASAAGGGH